MAATPAFAADVYVPVILHSAVGNPAAAQTANEHRSWGGWGGRRHRDDVSVGDVLTGVLIIGGIAAIASAASKSNRDRNRDDTYRYPNRDWRSQSGRYGEPVPQRSWGNDRNIDRAVDSCVSEVERGTGNSGERRVETVDTVARESDGWRVSGQINGGGTFSCTVGRDGTIRSVDGGPDRAAYDGTGEDDRPEFPG
ncbi:MAG TPA: hypothetical protein VHG29_13655 [Novosphingobium sp.]|nr:hypothetical protein [Novosphingobium sp.]